MPTMAEIKANHQGEHDILSAAFYAKKRSEEGVTPQEQAEFDAAHAAIWLDLEAELLTASDYVAPVPPVLETKVAELEAWKSNLLEWLGEQVGDPPTE